MWVRGHIQVHGGGTLMGSHRGRASISSTSQLIHSGPLRYDVRLVHGGQLRHGVSFAMIRRPFRIGELVQVWLAGAWQPGEIADDCGWTIGYSVVESVARNKLLRVRPERLRPLFLEGRDVVAYFGTDWGWIPTSIHCAPDLEEPPSDAEDIGLGIPILRSVASAEDLPPGEGQTARQSNRAAAGDGPPGGVEQFWQWTVIGNKLDHRWYPSYLLRQADVVPFSEGVVDC